MNFGTMLEGAKVGNLYCRRGWNGRDQYIGIQAPDAGGVNSGPYFFIRCVDSLRVPWLASQTDLLADDWRIYDAAYAKEADSIEARSAALTEWFSAERSENP